MTTHVALFRGINVGGHKIVKMERLRASFEALGFAEPRTYVQSGNVVYGAGAAAARDVAAMVRSIEARLLRDFGFAMPTIVRSAAALARIVRRNPFLDEAGMDPAKLHVVFLDRAPAKSMANAGARALDGGADRYRLAGRDIYLCVERGMGKSKLTTTAIERALGVAATGRNWRTVTTLLEMCGE